MNIIYYLSYVDIEFKSLDMCQYNEVLIEVRKTVWGYGRTLLKEGRGCIWYEGGMWTNRILRVKRGGGCMGKKAG